MTGEGVKREIGVWSWQNARPDPLYFFDPLYFLGVRVLGIHLKNALTKIK